MKRLMRCLAVAAFLAAAPAHPAEEVRMLAPEEFAVLPWDTTPGDPDALRTLRACGFNLSGFAAPEHLDAVAAAGLKCIVRDRAVHVTDAVSRLDETAIAERAAALVERAGNHEAVFGYYLRDEPGAAIYPGLKKWRDAFDAEDPGRPVLINLLPNYASPAQMNADSYEEYVESFAAMVRPQFLCYDHYALMDDGSIRPGYYQNLETIRAAALRHSIPFWNIVLSNAHFHYAEPTPAGFRFQLYTTLAHGARGIGYFTYFPRTRGNYRLAPIGHFGDRTPTWDMLRDVNLQLHRIGPVYARLHSVNVFHHPHVPEGCRGLESSLLLDSVGGGDLLVGEFEDGGGRPFVMIVNKDLERSCTFDLRFKDPGEVHFVNAYTGTMMPWVGENNWLAPGQGMLLTPVQP